jgi:pyruvate dehydrogenase E2 component (dihydrolipoamide acetyltransferase)
MEVVVPDIGDFSDVEVAEILVAVGDDIAVEDSLIVLETDKAALEVPATAAGKITEIKVRVGDKVSAGDVILSLHPAKEPAPEPQREAELPAKPESRGEEPPGGDASSGHAGGTPRIAEKVPDLGDFSAVEVVEVLVKAGDTVSAEDPLIVLETDKATMEVPAVHAGRIVELSVASGDHVSAGDTILVVETETPQERPEKAAVEPEPAKTASGPAQKPAAGKSSTPRRPRSVDERRFTQAHASPSVRKLARELGVDLGAVTGSGNKGRVTADDVKSFVKQVMQGGTPGHGLPKVPEVDFASFGPVKTEPLTRIQKISGPRLQASWLNIPHVTQHDTADITELEQSRRSLKEKAAERKIRLTPLAFIMRAAVLTLEEFPLFRSSLSSDGESLIVKDYFHIGFAADTPNGLVVPVIRDADRLDIFEIAAVLGELSAKAREGKLAAKEIQGGVFTISSLGGIGGSFFTPIINAPEVAILGVSRSQWQPVFRDEKFVPRLMLPLSLSYDHRVIDGAVAARFTTHLSKLLGQGIEALESGD